MTVDHMYVFNGQYVMSVLCHVYFLQSLFGHLLDGFIQNGAPRLCMQFELIRCLCYLLLLILFRSQMLLLLHGSWTPPLLSQNWTRSLSGRMLGEILVHREILIKITCSYPLNVALWYSNFSEIFDVDWFISYLKKDVKIIKELPQRRGQKWNPYTMRVPRKCNEHCYISRLLPVLIKKRVSWLVS